MAGTAVNPKTDDERYRGWFRTAVALDALAVALLADRRASGRH
jgi:hypothetical protein